MYFSMLYMKMEKEYTENLQDLVDSFQMKNIDLIDLEKLSLCDRFDTKFLIRPDCILEIIAKNKHAFSVLNVLGNKLQIYDSYYFDTPDFRSYSEHLRAKRNRFKIRKRAYVESALSFLEIKHKDKSGRTQKLRKRIDDFSPEIHEEHHSFLTKHGYPIKNLEAQLRVRFYRLTLADEQSNERITVDFGLQFERKDHILTLPFLAFVELKHADRNRKSILLNALKSHQIRPESFSKYCLGMSLLEPEIKSNLYKEKLLKINKMKTKYGILSNTNL